MSDKPDLTLIDMSPLDSMKKESFDVFKNMILIDKLKPSVALRKIMDEHNCPDLHGMTVIHLIEFTYPELDISQNNFTYKINDSGYPRVQVDLDDEAFDKLVEETRILPPTEW